MFVYFHACAPRRAWIRPSLPWLYSSEACLRWGWKCPRMALCWFSLMLEPSSAAKQSAIEFAHSGRTLNRKEGSSHSFWSYCLTTRLKQSNSSVGFLFPFLFFPFSFWWALRKGAGMVGNWLFGFLSFLCSWRASFHASHSGTHFFNSKI